MATSIEGGTGGAGAALSAVAKLPSPRLRVLLVSHVGELGGAERSLLDLVDGLRQLPAGDIGISLLAAVPADGPLARALERAGVGVELCPALARIERRASCSAVARLARGAYALRALVRRRGIDVVHANAATAAIYASLVPCPLVWHVRDLRCGVEARWLGRAASLAIAPSRACAEMVAARGAAPRVELVPNGIDVDGLARIVRRRAPAAPPTAIAVGHLVGWKRYDLLLAAVALVRQRGTPLHLTVLGGAPFGDEAAALGRWRACAAAHGLTGAVEFAGTVPDVAPWLARADILVHCAFPEPFGRAVVEAMAAGVPVVAIAGNHGPAEILAGGTGGWLADAPTPEAVAAALVAALGDAQQLAARGESGRIKALALYRRDRMAARVAALYREVAPACRRPPGREATTS